MVLCAEQRQQNNEQCRPRTSHLIFCAQWFNFGGKLKLRVRVGPGKGVANPVKNWAIKG